MDQRITKLLYMAVGLASTSEKVRAMLRKMDVEGQLTEEEGKRIVDELLNTGKEQANELKNEVRDNLLSLMREMQTPTMNDVEKLNQRIAELEARLKEKEGNG
jgi:polyhydroxyalkanoate synthesis regulator phasin